MTHPRIAYLTIALLALGPVTLAQELRTPAEESGFTEYTSYDEMMEYLQAVQATTTEMKLSSYGETWEGRELPFAIFSRPTITQPWEALVSGKPIVFCHANVHGGERTLRESVLILVRELATKGTPANDLLDDLVILVAPQINPDGFEATDRGTRGNSWGIDMNRDYMKTEQAAVANLVTNMHNVWHPHVIIDGHNGGSRPYDLCYQANSNASPSQTISDLCDFELFPYINQRMEADGFRSFYYSGGNAERWNGGGFDPRISRNYAAFINSIGILFESPHGLQTLEAGAKAGIVGYMAVLEFTANNPDKVVGVVNAARRETIALGENPGGEVMVQMEYAPEDWKVSYELRDGTVVEEGLLIKKPVVTQSRTRPYAYILPREARDAVAMLQRQNITVEVLQQPVTLNVESYALEDVEYLREYNHAAAVRVTVGEVLRTEQTFPAGSFVVSTAQMNGRVVAHMLEPETNDNVVRWNTMDAWLPKTRIGAQAEAAAQEAAARRGRGQAAAAGQRGLGQRGGRGRGQGRGGRRGRGRGGNQGPPVIPIYKVMTPTPMPTKILK